MAVVAGRCGKDDPVVALLMRWRRHQSADATIALCTELGARNGGTPAEIDYITHTVERLHADDPQVLRALGCLQMARGMVQEARAMLAHAKHVQAAAERTREHRPPELLLAALCAIDDDDAIACLAGPATGQTPAQRPLPPMRLPPVHSPKRAPTATSSAPPGR